VRLLKLLSGVFCTFWVSLGVLLLTATNAKSETLSKQPPLQKETHFTPVVLSVLSKPHPVKGTDSLIHFVYELHVTNTTAFPLRVESVEILDGEQHEHVLAGFPGKLVPKIMQGLITKSPTDILEGGEGAIIFVHFTMEKSKAQFTSLAHKLTIAGEFPPGFTHFLGLPASKQQIVEIGGVTNIHPIRHLVIGPPLEGSGWIAADGCCTAKRHVRAIMPINGKLRLAQRFAIDWEIMSDERRLFVGAPSDVQSYFSYGRKVLAVADSTVVRVVDQFEDQIPGKLPTSMMLDEVNGNHIVLDLGNGQFAFYAHLQPGSVKARGVKVGDRVCRGQILGLVGNSGNTSAPHLHFHLMSSPSTLGSNGLPYVIEEFELLGKVPSTSAFDKAEQDGTPLAIQTINNPGTRSMELPLDLSVVEFPSPKNCVPSGGGNR
jgi:hypothetical protein